MNASQVIDSYVRDVAQYLPRDKRNDVAFELRALLADELAAKAAAAGKPPDQAMVMELLAGFGRPAEAASRYAPRAPIIDPADNHNLFIWALVGSVVATLRNPQAGITFLGWVGAVFLVFAGLAWARRRQGPGVLRWRPKRVEKPAAMPRILALIPVVALLAFPVFQYLAPQAFVRLAFLGAVPTSGLEFTQAFRDSWQRAATLLAFAGVVGVHLAVLVRGGWRPWSRWGIAVANAGLGLLLVAHALPMRTLLSREPFEIFESTLANRVAMPIFGAVGAMLVLAALYDGYREWARIEPAPAL